MQSATGRFALSLASGRTLHKVLFVMQQEQPATPEEKLAVAFATALVAGDFAAAHGMLSSDLQALLTPSSLRESLYSTFSGYSDCEPERIWFDPAGVTQEWPKKRPDEVCWVYVGIEGEDFNEAVSVLVTKLNDDLVITELNWGRP